MDIIDNLLAQDRKVVVFSSYKEPLAMLEAKYKDVSVKIDGSVSAYNRETLITKFREDENTTVFLGNIIAAGQSINLQNAADVIFVNFPFTPSELSQAIARCDRIGQTSKVNVYYTIAEHSIDEHLFDLVGDKQNDINALIDPGKETINYGSIPEQLFRTLIENFKHEQGDEVPGEDKAGGDDKLPVDNAREQEAAFDFRAGDMGDKEI